MNGSANNEKSKAVSGRIIFEKRQKKTELYSIFCISAIIISLLLLIVKLYLPAGILLIATSSFALVLIRSEKSLFSSMLNAYLDASQMNEKKDEVIKNFSHRIREPLNNLVLITDILRESELREKQKDLLDTFIASTQNMVTTVNELTMHSAGDVGIEPRKQIRFRLLPTIENTIELYNLKEQSKIDFILNKKDFEDFDIYGDPIIIKQMFLSVFNKIESHPSDKVILVTINLRKESEGQNVTIVTVRIQTDIVISFINKKDQEKNLTERLIAAGKGTCSEESSANSTVLSVSLPLKTAVAEIKTKISGKKIESLLSKEKVKKDIKDLKVLLVEDNLVNQRITLLTLDPLVHSIDTATNGKEALDKFGKTSYDLILMDIQMPVMSGLVAAEKIRALEASTNTHVPIIAITANAMLGDKENCISAGIDDYISKPFQPSALIETIKRNI